VYDSTEAIEAANALADLDEQLGGEEGRREARAPEATSAAMKEVEERRRSAPRLGVGRREPGAAGRRREGEITRLRGSLSERRPSTEARTASCRKSGTI
jgi:hypothetical protein